jgi:hypothetical protein
MGWHELDSSGSGQGPAVSSCEHGNKDSGPIKCWGNTSVAEQPMVSHEGLRSVELGTYWTQL